MHTENRDRPVCEKIKKVKTQRGKIRKRERERAIAVFTVSQSALACALFKATEMVLSHTHTDTHMHRPRSRWALTSIIKYHGMLLQVSGFKPQAWPVKISHLLHFLLYHSTMNRNGKWIGVFEEAHCISRQCAGFKTLLFVAYNMHFKEMSHTSIGYHSI